MDFAEHEKNYKRNRGKVQLFDKQADFPCDWMLATIDEESTRLPEYPSLLFRIVQIGFCRLHDAYRLALEPAPEIHDITG